MPEFIDQIHSTVLLVYTYIHVHVHAYSYATTKMGGSWGGRDAPFLGVGRCPKKAKLKQGQKVFLIDI